MKDLVAVIRNRNLALLLSGRIVSTTGDWFYSIALSVAIYGYSHGNTVYVGLLWIVRLIPSLVFGPIAGALADESDVAAVAASPTRLAVVPTPTSVPVASAPSTAVPASPTVVASPTAIPPTETPTPIPVAYNETRLTDVLGESITSYAGSVPPRAHNVQLATRLINGAKVAPGAVFSFDATVGDQTSAHGFQVAWGIISNNGQPETVQADAGGICQVATTLFQSIYWAGLPLVRRFHHLYWIAHYGTPPYGGIGLDATVDFPPVDLQFKNTTSDWIRVDASYDSTHVHIQLRGASPGWLVTVGKPLIFNPVTVDRTIVRRGDPTMAPGTELTVEAAQDGFDVTLERLVKTKSGDLVDRYVFTNHYEPAHNVVVYGTKGLAPTPAVTITPTGCVLPGSRTAPAKLRARSNACALVDLFFSAICCCSRSWRAAADVTRTPSARPIWEDSNHPPDLCCCPRHIARK